MLRVEHSRWHVSPFCWRMPMSDATSWLWVRLPHRPPPPPVSTHCTLRDKNMETLERNWNHNLRFHGRNVWLPEWNVKGVAEEGAGIINTICHRERSERGVGENYVMVKFVYILIKVWHISRHIQIYLFFNNNVKAIHFIASSSRLAGEAITVSVNRRSLIWPCANMTS
jgi:hypothetical protein